MRFVTKLSIFLISMVIALTLAEAALQLYVTKIVGRGKLFSADPGTGWRPLPMLQLTRLNAGGEKWRIETDRTGQRVLDVPANPKRTILILGDSYAFGEGVSIEDRFDQRIREAFPDGRIINTGVMGFGTDQQYVAAKPYFPLLTDNDVVLVVFGRNDFFDVQRRRFVLRSKPYFEKVASGYELRQPSLSLLDFARDWSYLMALLSRSLEPVENAHWDAPKATEIIRLILVLIRSEIPRGAQIVLAYNGDRFDGVLDKKYTGALFCDQIELCIDLEPGVATSPANYLPDGHWSVPGNTAAGNIIAEKLREYLSK